MEKVSLNLLCFLFPICFTTTFAQIPHICNYGNGNYTSNSTYEKNLNLLLSSLPSNGQNDQYGFYNFSAGQSPDKVHGIVLCRGDVTQDTCQSCFNKSAQELPQRCLTQKEAIIWYDECMLRYSNRSIYGISETGPTVHMWNLNNASDITQFKSALGSLMSRLSGEAGSGGSLKKFASGKTNFSDFQNISGLAQCTPDITELSCLNCLEGAISEIPNCCDSKVGGRVLKPSCNIRYEVYQFFTSSTAAADAPAPLSIPPPTTSPTNTTTTTEKKNNTSRTVIIIVVLIVSFIVLLILAWMVILRRKPWKKLPNTDDIIHAESLQFDLATIETATNNFSDANKLGQGGFGSVYKGVLPNGQEIAVKRLAKNSEQGELEFKNEVLLVVKLQHRNLVRLQGFCLEREERLLIYEFVPNASLDHFIFDPTKRGQLDWETRYKIIEGIGRGLLYLHVDSRLRIIHRDLKASNILLDAEMTAKISDFGMARLFAMDQTQGATSRIVGTYGYMAPEYVMHGQFSVKSDVFSFGVLILEIISGRKNIYFRHRQTVEDLLSYAWRNWTEGTVLNIVDSKLVGGSRNEIKRCIHIGLLCAQENVAERPTMASIVLMLNSLSLTLPVPSQPPFFPESDVSA